MFGTLYIIRGKPALVVGHLKGECFVGGSNPFNCKK